MTYRGAYERPALQTRGLACISLRVEVFQVA